MRRLGRLEARPARPTPARAVERHLHLFLHRLRPEDDLVDVDRAAPGAGAAGASSRARANLDPALAHPLIVAAWRRLGARRRRYFRDLLPTGGRATETTRDRLRAAGAEAADAFDDWAAFLEGFAEQSHGRRGSSARSATRGCCASARAWLTTRAACARSGQAEYDRLDARDAASWPARSRGTRRLAHGPARRPTRTTRATEEAMRAGLRGLDRAGARLPGRDGPRHAARRRAVPGRAVTGLPAAGDRRGVVHRRRRRSPTRCTGHFFVPFAPDGTPEEEMPEAAASRTATAASPRPPCTRHIPATTGT